MKILHILNDIRKVGNGIVNVAVDLACLQAQAGYQVSVVSGGGEYEKLLMQHNIKHFSLDQTRTWRNLIPAVSQYRAVVQQIQPDIVHAHMMTGVVLAKASRLNSPYRLVSTVHNDFQRSAALMGLADRVIAVSRAVADSMHQWGIPQSKLRVVYNATIGSPRQRHTITCEPLPLQRPAITTVAGLNPRKGIADLIEGFNQVATTLSSAHLYIVGDGPNRSQFESQAKASPFAKRIHFEGFQLEPRCYLRSTDVFVLASRQDPFPLAISEAREAGCAIVASRAGGIPEALDDGSAGLLVAPGDSASIAAALKLLLEDSACLEHWRQKAQKNLENLGVARMHKETLALYEEVIREKRELNGRVRFRRRQR